MSNRANGAAAAAADLRYQRPGWQDPTLVGTSRAKPPLVAAFLTTFDPPQASVLVQDLLPEWLGLANSYADEGNDKLRFYTELEDSLKRMDGRFSIVSTAGAQEQGGHGWIWRYIRRHQVGFKRAAVQHAKLWMFHRSAAVGQLETLEIIISSQNLTSSGFKDQIQAGWRCVVPLAESPSRTPSSWGALDEFLRELGEACGPLGVKNVEYWACLLARAKFPGGATFVASVPGTFSAMPRKGRPAWGVSALRRVLSGKPASLVAMVPTVGNWDDSSLSSWTRIAGLEVRHLGLAWIEQDHPWSGSWQLNAATEDALSAAGIAWRSLPSPATRAAWKSPLCVEHRQGDVRWSHAKLYELRSGEERRLLITSANFSRAAWGNPRGNEIEIGNFELGVAIQADAGLWRLPSGRTGKRATSQTNFQVTEEQPIAWLAAEWDGVGVCVRVRLSVGELLATTAKVKSSRNGRLVALRLPALEEGVARLGWDNGSHGDPLQITLSTRSGYEAVIAVEDARPPRVDEWLNEAGTQREIQDVADRLLEEKYTFFDDDSRGDGSGKDTKGSTPNGAGYGVATYEDSRRRFAAIDFWAEALTNADALTRGYVLADGRRIAGIWGARAAGGRSGIELSARLAAEELLSRIRDAEGTSDD